MTKYYDPIGTYKAYSNDGKNLYSDSGEHIGHFLNGFSTTQKEPHLVMSWGSVYWINGVNFFITRTKTV